jgi:predicted ATPase
MLTRIEIDGFKTFRNFSVDLLPFQVILGPNAVGKSNLFDALHLLSRLAEVDLYKAFQGLRGEPSEMFSISSDGETVDEMRFALEVLMDRVVRDPWGVEVNLTNSRIRYELTLARRSTSNGVERLFVTRESAQRIAGQADGWVKPASKRFREAYVRRTRRGPLLDTTTKDGQRAFEIYQDGRAGRKRPADAAESTNLSSITTAEFPHLFALREELRSWRFLQLNPEALRRPASTLSTNRLTHDGSNLAAVLARIQKETKAKHRPRGVVSDIETTLSHLVPGVRFLEIVEDEKRNEYRIDITMQDGSTFPSRVLSDGTLRILALVVLMHDPTERGLVCFEEPENGVHPFRLGQMVETLRALATDLDDENADSEEPLRQVLLNSHSPVVLRSLPDSQVLFAGVVTQMDPENSPASIRCTRLRPVQRQGELLDATSRERVTRDEVNAYLETAAPVRDSAP